MLSKGWRLRSLGVVGAVTWATLLFACSDPPPPQPPPPPPQPQCNGVLQTTCLPPMVLPPGQCMPAAQIGGTCTGMYALSEGTLGPQGCCYTVCMGIPGNCGPQQPPPNMQPQQQPGMQPQR